MEVPIRRVDWKGGLLGEREEGTKAHCQVRHNIGRPPVLVVLIGCSRIVLISLRGPAGFLHTEGPTTLGTRPSPRHTAQQQPRLDRRWAFASPLPTPRAGRCGPDR